MPQSPGSKKTSNEPDPKGSKSFLKYAGMGSQMLAIILIFVWIGSKLDERASSEKPVYVAIFSLLGVFAGLYTVLKDLIRKDES